MSSDKGNYLGLKPRLLDLFCGAGGAARGYQLAGFHVTGIDFKPQKRFAGDAFIQSDALEYLREHGHAYDVIHASPPCQAHTSLKSLHKNSDYAKRHVDLVAKTRLALREIGKPYVIENVPGAPLENPLVLCGSQFDLKVYRHRLFESNILLFSLPHASHKDNIQGVGRGLSSKGFLSIAGSGGFGDGVSIDYARQAMACEWMCRRELSQAIPPAYTEFIGKQLMGCLESRGLYVTG